MPFTVNADAHPSTLADVLRQVRDAFEAMGDTAPGLVSVGKQYLEEFGAGSAARVLFVPDPKGKWGAAIEMGNAGSITHSCDVYVRAQETGDEFTRLSNAYALADRVIALLRVAATGRLEGGPYADDSPTDVDAYGADLAFSFTYQRDVRLDAARAALPPATADTSDAEPLVPPGAPASDVTINVTTDPKE